jgi:hypothetical protein
VVRVSVQDSEETVAVAPEDVLDTDAGTMLRADGAKGGGYRETPIPPNLATRILLFHTIVE